MKLAIAMALALTVASTSAHAASYVLDFDTTDDTNATLDSSMSQVISDPRLMIDDGIRWLVDADGGEGAALFNSTCAGYTGGDGCNGDADLKPADQNNADGVKGNVLIQQRSQDGATPNDDAKTNLIWTGVSAIDNGTYRFGTSQDLADLGSITLTGEAETGSTTFASSILSKGDKIFLYFDRQGSSNQDSTDSGAIDNLKFSVVPLPAGLPLMLGGFGLLAWMRKRKNAA